jgi:hypothetical protein
VPLRPLSLQTAGAGLNFAATEFIVLRGGWLPSSSLTFGSQPEAENPDRAFGWMLCVHIFFEVSHDAMESSPESYVCHPVRFSWRRV